MHGMFSVADLFNQPLNSWNVSKVTKMNLMFYNASSFNQPLNSWDVSSVFDISNMFMGASSFNQPLNSWNVSSVVKMHGMFSAADLFNQPLNSWNVSSVISMSNMFKRASSFNQDIGLWVIKDDCDVTSIFYLSGVTRDTFLPEGNGQGIYGIKIANYFNPNLPNPKTNDQLIEIRTRWERRGTLIMSLKKSIDNPDVTELGKGIHNIPDELKRNVTKYLGGA